MKAGFYHGLSCLFVVWLVLFTLVGAQQSAKVQNTVPPQVFFDHLYIVVDENTYEAVKKSEFIKDTFCMYMEDTVSNEDETYTGAYLHGEHNYIEIFGPDGFEGAKEGAVGLGFITTRAGDINIVCEGYKRHFGEGLEAELTYFVSDTSKFPWYYALASDSSEENPISTWVMEYHPTNLQFMGVIPDSTGFISREACMTAMITMIASAADRLPEPMLFRNITAISLIMTQGELDRLSMELSAMSYTKEIQNNVTSFHGPGIDITCRVKPDPGYRVQALDFSLSRKPESEMIMQLGANSVLTIFKDGTGQWKFTE